jgi:hypothetical protein
MRRSERRDKTCSSSGRERGGGFPYTSRELTAAILSGHRGDGTQIHISVTRGPQARQVRRF